MKLTDFANLTPGDRVILRPRTKSDRYKVIELVTTGTYAPLGGLGTHQFRPNTNGKYKEFKTLHELIPSPDPATGNLVLEWEEVTDFTVYRSARDIEARATDDAISEVEHTLHTRLAPIYEVRKEEHERRAKAAQSRENDREFLMRQLGPDYAHRLHTGAMFSISDVAQMIRTVLD